MSQAIRGPVAAAPRVRPTLLRLLGNAHPVTGNQLQVMRAAGDGKSGAWVGAHQRAQDDERAHVTTGEA